MKKIIVKRLVYTNLRGASYIGGEEYDGALSNDAILSSIYHINKHRWIGNELLAIQDEVPVYRISVQNFYKYQKSWYDILLDAISRI